MTRPFAAALFILSMSVSPARGQFMYLDANGDGVNSTSERLNVVGNTTLDIWLDTNHNRDGSEATCADGVSALSLNSYAMILQAGGGTINWGTFTNHQPSMVTQLGVASNSTTYRNGRAGTTMLPPGLYRLASIVVSIASGSPSVLIVPSTTLNGSYATLFGSACLGADFDNSMKLGIDWFDAAGVLTSADLPHLVVQAPFRSFDAGAVGPGSIAISDFNRDGRLDLATSNRNDNTVSILLAELAGPTFSQRTTYATGSAPSGVAAADFNGDGKGDLVVVNSGSNSVSLLLGNGDGTFAAKTDFGVGTGPEEVAVGDLNANGTQDLVVTNTAGFNGNSVSVLLGNGNGTFAAQVAYQVGLGPFGVALGQVTGSSALDAVIADWAGRAVSVLTGVGNGTFTDHVAYDLVIWQNPVSVAVANLDGLGNEDIVVASHGSGGVAILKNLTGGPPSFIDGYNTGGTPTGLVVRDITNDGLPDVVVATATGEDLVFLHGVGNGFFYVPPPDGELTRFTAGRYPHRLASADFNRDGIIDVAVSNYNSGTITVHQGNGNGTFGQKTVFPTTHGGRAIVADNFNSNPLTDLAVGEDIANFLEILPGKPGGVFGPGGQQYAVTPGFAGAFASADINNDSHTDIATANAGSGDVSVFKGNSTTFQFWINYATGQGPTSVALGLLDANLFPDLAVTNAGSNTVSVLLGLGNLEFGPKSDLVTGATPKAVGIGDFNVDGKRDVAVANSGAGTVSIWLGTGTGGFGTRVDFPTAPNPVALAIGNLNADSAPDLAVVCSNGPPSPGVVSVLLGTGSGAFGSRVDYACGNNPIAIAIGNLDGQATFDIAATNYYSNTVSIFRGNGDGTFRPKVDFGAGREPYGLALGDFDQDGRIDFAVTNYIEKQVSVLFNRQVVTSVPNDAGDSAPLATRGLHQNFPNPFNPTTTIQFALPNEESIRLAIYDIHGRLVRLLAEGVLPSGLHSLTWDGRDDLRKSVASGVYFYRLEAGVFHSTRRMVLLK